MASPASATFTMPDRRKKVVTYGRSARFTAPQNLQDDAPSLERPRKHATTALATVKATAPTKASSTLNSTHTPRPRRSTPEDVFDVPSDNEPTPRPAAATKKKGAPAKGFVDEYEFPASEDERPRTSRKAGKITLPLRKLGPATRIPKTSLARPTVSSSDEAQVAQIPPARSRRAKTPQAIQIPADTTRTETALRNSVKRNTRSRGTTPAAPGAGAQKTVRSTVRVPTSKVASKPVVSSSADPDIFDFPSAEEEAPARTPIRPRPAPLSRTKPTPAAPIIHAPPSPAPSIESDASTTSHKRKRRASASSSATVRPARPTQARDGGPVSQRSKKYQKKEDIISPGRETNVPTQPIPRVPTRPIEQSGQAIKRARVPTRSNATKPHITKGQSSPASLHTMLAVRSLPKSTPVPHVQPEAPLEDETMYDIPEFATPLARAPKPNIPGSVTPRQQALFSNLLGDSSESSPSMPSISRLRLTEQRPRPGLAALNRSSSDIPQSAHARKGRLIDTLKQAASSSDEDSESDEETEEDIAEIPAVSAPTESVTQSQSTTQATSDKMDLDSDAASNSQASHAAVHLPSGSKRTYAKERSMLEENNLEDALMLAMDVDDSLGLGSSNREASASEDGEELSQVRGINELRSQGQQYRFRSEASASIDDISEKGGLNSSQRRSAVMEIATRMADSAYVGQLLESSLTASLLRSIAPSGEIMFDLSAAVVVLFILQTRPGYAVLNQIYQSKVLGTLDKLMMSNFSSFDIHRIAKDRKTNMSMTARDSVAEFRAVILDVVWPEAKPEKVTPQLVALKVLEHLVLGLRKAGNTETVVGEATISRILDAATVPSQHLKAGMMSTQDHLTLSTAFSILEALSVSHGKQVTWSNETLSRLANMTPILFETSSESPIRLVIRLCMNLTNNKPQACQMFAWPSFVLPLLRLIGRNYQLLAIELEVERRNSVLEDLILSLGAMINLAEYSDQARASVVRDGNELIDELVTVFLEGSARAEQADSMEESQSSVTIGYLTVLLGNLCLNASVRATIQARLPGGNIDMLVRKVREFVLYNQRVDRLTRQFESEEGEETLKNFTARLMRVVEGLERLGG